MAEEKEIFQNTVQFLMYSYFGKWEEDPLYVAISRAYRDATMRGAFSFPDPDMKDVLKICGSEIIHQGILYYLGGGFITESYINKNNTAANNMWENKELKKKINGKISQLNRENKDEYTVWHESLCTKLVTLYSFAFEKIKGKSQEKDTCPFSYGNAQKWINMTVKYLYLMSPRFKGENNVTWPEKIEDKLKLIHIPLDSYILRALFYKPGPTSKNYKDSIRKQINENQGELIKSCLKDDKYFGSVNSDGSLKKKNWGIEGDKDFVTWSNIASYEDYDKIQMAVKKQIPEGTEFESNPLVWENKVWIYASQIIND